MSFRYHNKRRRQLDDHRLDDWLMTYADMITLILCFFAIILSVSVVKQEKFEQVRQQVMGKFAAPEAAKGIAPPPAKQPATAKSIPGQQQGVAVENADRYYAIEMNSAPFFTSGSAELRPEGQGLLAGLLPTLQDKRFLDYQITVEGHTDDILIGTAQFPSNWELSTARAAVVVRFLINNGIPATKLRAVGYAEVLPKVPNRDLSGRPIPDNQAQNRRVVIKLEKIEKG
ncbi:MAG: OmpA family protein [Syntrophales bacterium LBB04]|nr:OmpA family protein [Syntrophales bacterium LBB04]